MRFDHGEKIHLLSTCCSSEKKKQKKNSRLCTIFPDYISIFNTFSRSANCWANFKKFFKN